MGGLLPVAEAQARMLALSGGLPVETVPLIEAAGRYAAAPVLARRTQPAMPLSAMDGYAIRFAERPGPWTVVGESAAGSGFDRTLAPGESARIFTGAPMPDGADTILIQEEATSDGDRLSMTGEGPRAIGAHIRPAGGDFAEGDALIATGALLTPPAIALAAAAGHGSLAVHRRPRVAILSTGNELVEAGEPTPGSLLPASNGPMIAALLSPLPAVVTDHGVVRDDLDTIAAAFIAMAAGADIIVTTGGASVGDHDLVLPALEKVGARIDFWKIAMKPGKPMMIGMLGDTIVLGLPGNPVSAFVTATLFLKPLVAHLLGSLDPLPRMTTMMLGAPLPATGVRAEYPRISTTGGIAHPVAGQDSAGLAALAAADHIAVRPAHAPAAPAGAQVQLIALA